MVPGSKTDFAESPEDIVELKIPEKGVAKIPVMEYKNETECEKHFNNTKNIVCCMTGF